MLRAQEWKTFILKNESSTPKSETFILRSETFILRNERIIPGSEQFILWSDPFIPRSEQFILRNKRIILGSERLILRNRARFSGIAHDSRIIFADLPNRPPFFTIKTYAQTLYAQTGTRTRDAR